MNILGHITPKRVLIISGKVDITEQRALKIISRRWEKESGNAVEG
jgi:hypothetical protein